MALIQCPECGQNVSDAAKICVHCGFVLQEQEVTTETVAPAVEATVEEAAVAPAVEATVEEAAVAPAVEATVKKEKLKYDVAKFAKLTAKWETEDTKAVTIFRWLRLVELAVYVLTLVVPLISMIRAGEAGEINGLEDVLYYFKWMFIGFFVSAARSIAQKVVEVLRERRQMADLNEFGKEETIAYLEQIQKENGLTSVWLFSKLAKLAMPLAVPEEKQKRAIFDVLGILVTAAFELFFIIWGIMVSNKIIAGNGDFWILIFNDMLSHTLLLLGLMVADIACVLLDKRDSRSLEWATGKIKSK